MGRNIDGSMVASCGPISHLTTSSPHYAAPLWRFAMSAALLLSFALSSPPSAAADEVRVVDPTGLVRSVKVVHANGARIVVSMRDKSAAGQCVATNVDGMAGPRRVSVEHGECVFAGVSAGTWQVTTEPPARWAVHIDE